MHKRVPDVVNVANAVNPVTAGEAFYRVAQAASDILPIENKEKKLRDGFLAGRERLREKVRKEDVWTRLFE